MAIEHCTIWIRRANECSPPSIILHMTNTATVKIQTIFCVEYRANPDSCATMRMHKTMLCLDINSHMWSAIWISRGKFVIWVIWVICYVQLRTRAAQALLIKQHWDEINIEIWSTFHLNWISSRTSQSSWQSPNFIVSIIHRYYYLAYGYGLCGLCGLCVPAVDGRTISGSYAMRLNNFP